MHIPDNYLSPSTCAAVGAAMLPVWSVAARKVKNEITKEKIPMLGIGAALSFLLMMFNIPLPGGTTGHAVGGTLLAILIGPYAACISLTAALLIQALMFGDGGVLAFGANCFNITFVLPFAGYFIYSFIRKRVSTERGRIAAVAIASYAAINLSALCAAIMFGIQPILFRDAMGLPMYSPYPLEVSIPAMVIPHLLVAGFVELVFTVGIYNFIKSVSPGSIYETGKKRTGAVYGLIAALICLTPVGLIASGTAWGEWGADEISAVVSGGKLLGYIPEGMQSGFSFFSLLPDYTLKGIPDTAAYVMSAVLGASIMIIVFKIAGSLRKSGVGRNAG